MDDAQRLAAFEQVLACVLTEREQIDARMEDLRIKGKVKSVSYQQYYALRHELDAMIARFREHGLV